MANKTFAIYHTWPDLKNAEFEVIQRILSAANNIGAKVVVIDNSGFVLWSSQELSIRRGSRIVPESVDFAISLHFESPRVCDIYTYYALWQPLQFYEDFGYQISLDKFSTHNDFLSCHSDLADNHALNLFNGLQRPVMTPLPTLFHSLPEPFLEPDISANATLFYIGINWERIGRPKGRYHDLLVRLDARELINIYGPEQIHGVAPWAGFKTYSGELPFDGVSVTRAINNCGVCLALSSAAHKSTGIMSNRLFEGLASGAAVIATPNALIDKYFRDVVYVVEDHQGEAYLEQQIVSVLREIRRDPAKAEERVRAGQEILRKICSLEKSLEALFVQTPERRRHFVNSSLTEVDVTVILQLQGIDLNATVGKIREYSRQILCSVHLNIIAEPALIRDLDVMLSDIEMGSVKSVSLHPFDFEPSPEKFEGVPERSSATGQVIGAILSRNMSPYFAILNQCDEILSDHFASLAKSITRTKDSSCAISGSIVRSRDLKGKEYCSLFALGTSDQEALMAVQSNEKSGRFLFSSSLISQSYEPLLRLLDGEEHSLFALVALMNGPLERTAYATHIEDQTVPLSIREPAYAVDLQRQFIRDHFSHNGRWFSQMGYGKTIAAKTSQRAAASVRWETYHTRQHETKMVEIDRCYRTNLGGDGGEFLAAGFFDPEANAAWMGDERGVIEFSLPRHAAEHIEDFQIVLEMSGRKSIATGRDQHCTFILNQMAIAYTDLAERIGQIRLKIPMDILRTTSTFRLEIIADHADPVFDDHGKIIDPRPLSALLYSIAIIRDSDERLPIFNVNTTYSLAEGGEGTRALVRGFYGPERSVTWVCGRQGEIRFRIDKKPANPIFHIKIAGRSANGSGASQQVLVTLNGAKLAQTKVGHEARVLSFPLRDELREINHVLLDADHAEPVLDEHGSVLDPRLLGVSVLEIGVTDGDVAPSKPSRKWARRVSRRLKRAFQAGGEA